MRNSVGIDWTCLWKDKPPKRSSLTQSSSFLYHEGQWGLDGPFPSWQGDWGMEDMPKRLNPEAKTLPSAPSVLAKANHLAPPQLEEWLGPGGIVRVFGQHYLFNWKEQGGLPAIPGMIFCDVIKDRGLELWAPRGWRLYRHSCGTRHTAGTLLLRYADSGTRAGTQGGHWVPERWQTWCWGPGVWARHFKPL